MPIEFYSPDYVLFEEIHITTIICDLEGNVTLYGDFYELFATAPSSVFGEQEPIHSYLSCDWAYLDRLLVNREDEQSKKVWHQIKAYLTEVKAEPLVIKLDESIILDNNVWIMYEPKIAYVERKDFETQAEYEQMSKQIQNMHQGYLIDNSIGYSSWGKLPPMNRKILKRLYLDEQMERFNRLYQLYLLLVEMEYSEEQARKMLHLEYNLSFETAKQAYVWVRQYGEMKEIKSPFIVK